MIIFSQIFPTKIDDNLYTSTHFSVNHSSGHLLTPEYSQSSPYVTLPNTIMRLLLSKLSRIGELLKTLV
ncbi:unnamed protein product [Photorhabdus laumondii subsp. laumondii TTO1]|uniref:Photorhabdus luminescens subsp. laumondii TTO1 complete genome segment 1/17 n=1 Tax=Photorhabdus laumondii subsp. laumondii (strain DSM 15139 / CIP 105565 / TT01) TaxID=243265 RepID=Q7NAB8_PHOLL|nr:unnamed protein product [Photorhabdus laumondii subsp. laumondii TTO1]